MEVKFSLFGVPALMLSPQRGFSLSLTLTRKYPPYNPIFFFNISCVIFIIVPILISYCFIYLSILWPLPHPPPPLPFNPKAGM